MKNIYSNLEKKSLKAELYNYATIEIEESDSERATYSIDKPAAMASICYKYNHSLLSPTDSFHTNALKMGT